MEDWKNAFVLSPEVSRLNSLRRTAAAVVGDGVLVLEFQRSDFGCELALLCHLLELFVFPCTSAVATAAVGDVEQGGVLILDLLT